MKFDELKFVRIVNIAVFARIPRYLFEQIEGRSWGVERLYAFAPLFLDNDANYFWVLVDDEQVIKGVLWAVIDVLSQKLNVIVFTVDKQYQDSFNLKNALDFLRNFIVNFNKDDNGIKLKEKINWVTAQPEKLKQIGGQILTRIMVEV